MAYAGNASKTIHRLHRLFFAICVIGVICGSCFAQKKLATEVKAEFLHAWNGYKKYAWGHDDLKPLSKTHHIENADCCSRRARFRSPDNASTAGKNASSAPKVVAPRAPVFMSA